MKVRNQFPVRAVRIIGMAIMAAILVAPVAEAGEYQKKSVEEYKLEGETRLVISNKKGRISVEGEEGRENIKLEIIKKVKTDREDEAEKITVEMGIEVERGGREMKITAMYPEDREKKKSILSYILGLGDNGKNVILLHALVPANLELVISTSSGEIEVWDMEGEVEATAASGNVEAYDLSGGLEISVASGDVEVSGIEGAINVKSASGDITAGDIRGAAVFSVASGDISVKGAREDLALHSASGDMRVVDAGNVSLKSISGSIDIEDIRGDISASTASGDIMMRLIPQGKVKYGINSSSGDVGLRFDSPLEGGFVLEAETVSGEINANLPINVSHIGRNRLAGIVRKGESEITIETSTGDVNISEPEEL